MKIRVCIPFYSEFEATKKGISELKNRKQHDFHIEPRQGTLIYQIRNSFINDFGRDILDFDSYLFIDSDICFNADNVFSLLAHDLDIVSGAYRRHSEPERIEAGYWLPKQPGAVQNRLYASEKGVREVDFVGMGFCLIKKRVFEAIQPDWFRHLEIDLDGRKTCVGEDYSFCMLAKEAGVKVFCDCDTKVDHVRRTQKSFNWSEKMRELPNNYDPQAQSIIKILLQLADDYRTLAQGYEEKKKEADRINKAQPNRSNSH